MLTSSNEYSKNFLLRKRLLLDSCVLIDLASQHRTTNILNQIHKQYSFVYCAVSMLEVGFGPANKACSLQNKLARSIYYGDDVIESNTLAFHVFDRSNKVPPASLVYSFCPSLHEWYAARFDLIKAMDVRNICAKRARELSNDAIIYSSAWNSRSALVTHNKKDFLLFNELRAKGDPNKTLPIFTVDDLDDALRRDVSFPENLRLTENGPD